MCQNLITPRKYKTCNCALAPTTALVTDSCASFNETGVQCAQPKDVHTGAKTVTSACPTHGDEGYGGRKG